ncbi:MAG: VacJ family lipoprotein [Alphaproteobacteria bacterium]|nr:VacJ family lipoprotein [Alphaproteobacteria bacterium]
MAVKVTTKKWKLALLTCGVLAAGSMMSACSTTAQTSEREIRGDVAVSETEINDPFESFNRGVFAFNQGFDNVILHPAIEGYRAVVPKPARTGLSNFLSNLKSPIHFANQVLQGDIAGAATVLERTIINTFLGFGLFDVAGSEGIEVEAEDFGQTLAVWGVGHGPYLVVPFLGPSSLRDYVGYAVDAYADPLRMYLFNIDQEGWAYARSGADYFVLRDSLMDVLKDLERSSVDYYAATRSIYVQRRAAMVADSDNGYADIPDFDE